MDPYGLCTNKKLIANEQEVKVAHIQFGIPGYFQNAKKKRIRILHGDFCRHLARLEND